MSQFYTSNGWLTRYAMACGYQHVTETPDLRVCFYMNNGELNTYDVTAYPQNGGERIWVTVEGLPAARQLYKRMAGKPQRRPRNPTEPNTIPMFVYA